MRTRAKRKVLDLPKVEVVWTDAAIRTEHEASLADPETVKSFGAPAVYHDIGYLVRKTSKELVLAVSVCPEDDSFRHANMIPRKWVLKIITLTELPDGKSPS